MGYGRFRPFLPIRRTTIDQIDTNRQQISKLVFFATEGTENTEVFSFSSVFSVANLCFFGGESGQDFGVFFASDRVAVDDGKAEEQNHGRDQADKDAQGGENGRWLLRQVG